MKNKIFTITFLGALILSFNSCSTSKIISNGGFSDLSLNIDSDEFEIMRLETIEGTGSAIFGIPKKVDETKGIVFRLNGINITSTNQLIPILTLLGNAAIVGYGINQAFGQTSQAHYNQWGFSHNTYTDNFPLPQSILIGLPAAAIINNLMHSKAAVSAAAFNVNSALIQNNPEIDVFLNPKYDINYENGFFKQSATIKANVMGAKIKAD